MTADPTTTPPGPARTARPPSPAQPRPNGTWPPAGDDTANGDHGRAPTLVELAEIVHRSTHHHPADLVVVTAADRGTVDIGVWPIPPEVAHPTDALVGWHPPAWARQVGLVTSGRTVAVDPAGPDDPGTPVRITVLVDHRGQAATVLDRPHADLELITEPPQGWGADALRRTLGLPTDPPVEGLGTCVEAAWVAAIAHALWSCDPSRSGTGTWGQVALLHPLHPAGPPVSPAELAAATTMLDVESSWEQMLHLFDRSCTTDPDGVGSVGAERLQPPLGRTVALREWFDAGSFARWSLRRQPPPGDLLYEVLDHLPEPVAIQVIDALVTIT